MDYFMVVLKEIGFFRICRDNCKVFEILMSERISKWLTREKLCVESNFIVCFYDIFIVFKVLLFKFINEKY